MCEGETVCCEGEEGEEARKVVEGPGHSTQQVSGPPAVQGHR